MKNNYIHSEIPELSGAFLDKGNICVGSGPGSEGSKAMEQALCAMDLALRLGLPPPSLSGPDDLPYGQKTATLVFKAPLLSAMANKKIMVLRGWSEFESCIKGFNSLGLMAEHVLREFNRIKSLPLAKQHELKLEFLRSRRVEDHIVYSGGELDAISESEFLEVDDRDIAIWQCFAGKTIVCSTSSNMGISTHQALRLMQKVVLRFRGREFRLLNRSEGSLIIWCPDERADFMNEEKTRSLRSLEQELPQITRLKTYINRQQRDPGALKDALLLGGYFFPTNPQSKHEMQNLVFVALNEIARERGRDIGEVLKDPNIRWTLESFGCEIQRDLLIVHSGVESGIYGLMIPYFIMLEQILKHDLERAVSAWNQASIGAALAGAVLADKFLRAPDTWRDDIRSEFNSFFPSLSRFLDTQRLGKDLRTQIHGVFDIANLQSLAQLLGVVVENHMSGRDTAYVGLGSSSYSNGNRCVDILRDSISGEGAFQGKNAFHAATHTLNPFAQALIFGEDLRRFLQPLGHRTSVTRQEVEDCMNHVKKPEPAGAAALAGYLLSRLDMRTLSILEIAYCLKLMGFSQDSFLEFAGYGTDGRGLRTFIQSAFEEGILMERFAQNMLVLLDWNLPELEKHMRSEKDQSRIRYWESPLDDRAFEHLDGPTCIYLTGDNTKQVRSELVSALAEACLRNQPKIEAFLDDFEKSIPRKRSNVPVDLDSFFLFRTAKTVDTQGTKSEIVRKKFDRHRLSESDFDPDHE